MYRQPNKLYSLFRYGIFTRGRQAFAFFVGLKRSLRIQFVLLRIKSMTFNFDKYIYFFFVMMFWAFGCIFYCPILKRVLNQRSIANKFNNLLQIFPL